MGYTPGTPRGTPRGTPWVTPPGNTWLTLPERRQDIPLPQDKPPYLVQRRISGHLFLVGKIQDERLEAE